MGFDVRVTQRRKILCPNCGEEVSHVDVECVDSGGVVWCEPLESIGYYVPYDKRTEENDWYGKDMVLSKEQAKQIRDFAKDSCAYNTIAISNLIAAASYDGDDVVINADW